MARARDQRRPVPSARDVADEVARHEEPDARRAEPLGHRAHAEQRAEQPVAEHDDGDAAEQRDDGRKIEPGRLHGGGY